MQTQERNINRKVLQRGHEKVDQTFLAVFGKSDDLVAMVTLVRVSVSHLAAHVRMSPCLDKGNAKR